MKLNRCDKVMVHMCNGKHDEALNIVRQMHTDNVAMARVLTELCDAVDIYVRRGVDCASEVREARELLRRVCHE